MGTPSGRRTALSQVQVGSMGYAQKSAPTQCENTAPELNPQPVWAGWRSTTRCSASRRTEAAMRNQKKTPRAKPRNTTRKRHSQPSVDRLVTHLLPVADLEELDALFALGESGDGEREFEA